MDINALKNFLEKNVLQQKIILIKQFGKGQVAVVYVKLEDSVELTIKFYKTESSCVHAYEIAESLNKNSELAAPRLYKLKDRYFCYENYFGLCFYFIEGSEISAERLNKQCFEEVAAAYEIFQKPIEISCSLYRDHSLQEYIKILREEYLNRQMLSDNPIKKIYFNIFIYFARKFVDLIENAHSTDEKVEQKLIHCDITKSNLLFKNGHFRSFIDMDAICYSYIGRDFAEFIISSVMHYPFYKSKRKSIKCWYEVILNKFKLSTLEYIYGLDIYYLYRLKCRIMQYQEKIGFCKVFNVIEFFCLRNYTAKIIKKLNK